MRVAVLLTGQPRYLTQGSHWWRERVFPDRFKNIKVDYFCYFWDDNNNVFDNTNKLYHPVRCHIGDYNSKFNEFRDAVKEANKDTDWSLVPDFVRYNICLDGDEISDYSRNFHGMFLSAAYGAKMLGDLSSEYDVVIKSRSDTVLNIMEEEQWLAVLGNMQRNPKFSENIFAPWLRIKEGAPFFGDLAFIGKPKLMHEFMVNIDKHLFNICTKDKHLFGELLVNNYGPIAHWMWSRLSLYSKTDWLAFSVVWPVPFGTALIRHDEDITNMRYAELEQKYNAEEQRRADLLLSDL